MFCHFTVCLRKAALLRCFSAFAYTNKIGHCFKQFKFQRMFKILQARCTIETVIWGLKGTTVKVWEKMSTFQRIFSTFLNKRLFFECYCRSYIVVVVRMRSTRLANNRNTVYNNNFLNKKENDGEQAKKCIDGSFSFSSC